MSKKTIFSVLLVLLLGLAGNAHADTVIIWDPCDPCSSGENLWKTPTNWDLQRVPSIATDDFAIIGREGELCCIIDASHTDANAAETNYLRVGHVSVGTGELQMDGGVLTVGETLIVGEDAIGRFYMNDGTITTTEGTWVGCGVAGNGSFTMSNGSLTTTFGPLVAGNEGGTGSLTIQGGNIEVGGGFQIGNNGGAGDLNVSGGTINIGSDLVGSKNFVIGRKGGTGTVNISGGTINVTNNLFVGKTGSLITGTGTLMMTGGKITAAKNLNIGSNGSTGHLQFDGGTIWAYELEMGTAGSSDPCGTMDIKAGTLIIDGDCIEKLAGYIEEPNGWITADGGNGKLVIDYDIRNSGKTTITAISSDSNLPQLTINVEPNEPNDIGIDSIIPPINEPIYYWQNQLISIGTGPSRKCPYVYRFDHWEGDVIDPCSPSTKVLMDSDKTIKVVFIKDNERECGDECHPILQGDLNADCYIDFEDFAIYVEMWLSCTHPDCDEL
jgi:hypothetical protein